MSGPPNPDAVPRCVFCVYKHAPASREDLSKLLASGLIRPAEMTIDTPDGPREVCREHAERRTWRG